MSTIRVDNFGPSAGGTTYSARGIAKAWVNFNGTGTIAARDSENVSSLTDNGTGDYSVNFTNAFGAGDYALSGSGGDDGVLLSFRGFSAFPPTTTLARVASTVSSTGSKADNAMLSTAFHGDLA